MPTTDEDRRIHFLSDVDCRRLLASEVIGRLGFTDGALPVILPVAYFLHAGDVLIPADQGSTVVTAVRGAVVAFEIDALDATTGSGWSVSVIGPSRVVTHPREVESMDALGPTGRPAGPGRCYISVRPGLVRGWSRGQPPVPE